LLWKLLEDPRFRHGKTLTLTFNPSGNHVAMSDGQWMRGPRRGLLAGVDSVHKMAQKINKVGPPGKKKKKKLTPGSGGKGARKKLRCGCAPAI
jgi:hypothetical protein